ncbi:uncharacterized protein LAJ45_08393 [Morchella importuna]|uniref:uncharacterized protein n=1 Tax=Morchella importuna TaxID=1174673 RepID=UPI001E8E95B1|nr:uncharacterized protein LAJ45_08393 [Morchella importuna]KAH8147566.1 hypothetical protein LAJ45_08393 [Morchella importuna]
MCGRGISLGVRLGLARVVNLSEKSNPWMAVVVIFPLLIVHHHHLQPDHYHYHHYLHHHNHNRHFPKNP